MAVSRQTRRRRETQQWREEIGESASPIFEQHALYGEPRPAKPAKSQRKRSAAGRSASTTRRETPKIAPIELTPTPRVPALWRARSLSIEPIFDQTFMQTPAQVNLAQVEQSLRALESAMPAQMASEQTDYGTMGAAPAMDEMAGQLAIEAMEQSRNPSGIPVGPAPPSVLPDAPLASEVISLEELAREQQLQALRTPISMPSMSVASAVAKPKRRRVGEQVVEWVSRLQRRLAALIARLRGPAITAGGQRTLLQLERLFALISAGVASDDMEQVRLRVAFGEAYYHVMEASRRHKSRGRTDRPEEYQAYVERFLRAESEE